MNPHARRWMLAAVALGLMAASASTGCKKAQFTQFPDSGTITGWQKTSETRVFEAKNLYEYIDGDAEQYISAGVMTTSTSDYKYEGQLEAVVDVHAMRDVTGAQTIMANLQSKEAKPIQLGDAGIEFTQSISFRKGIYVVRIVAYQSTPETGTALMALARGFEARM